MFYQLPMALKLNLVNLSYRTRPNINDFAEETVYGGAMSQQWRNNLPDVHNGRACQVMHFL